MRESLSISNIEIRIQRSERRKTIALTVERDGTVTANVPAGLALPEVARHFRGRELWLHSALARRASFPPTPPSKEYVSGEGFHYLGGAYRLRVIPVEGGSPQIPDLRFIRNRFEMRGDCVTRGRDCFVRWYSARAQEWLDARLPLLQRRVGVQVKRLAMQDLGYRWASCSASARLNFHWRTILLPPEMVEYIVLHELCHLIEHNHTDRFWSLVRRADRDYEHKERWLRENGGRFNL